MSLTDDLYREIILEHFKSPRNRGRLPAPNLRAQGANPFCGDELELTMALEGETLREIKFEAKGCSISQASASMMTEAIKGKTLEEAKGLAVSFKKVMLEGASASWSPELEDLESLEGVKKYPVRIKCAILGWNTFLEALAAHRKGQSQASHVEGEEGEHPSLTEKLTSEMVPSAAPSSNTGSSNPDRLKEEAQIALKEVIDPELNMNVVDLGLIYDVQIRGGSVQVTYTLTSPGCPLGPVIKGQINSALGKLPWVKEIQPELVWSPPWDPRTMASEEAKTELGIW